jgi:membrane protease YdiL (CAAX protease family)
MARWPDPVRWGRSVRRSPAAAPAPAQPAWTLPVAIAVLPAVNLVNNRLWPDGYVVTCGGTAVLLLLLARRDGCTDAELGLGRDAVPAGLLWSVAITLLVLLGYAVVVALPTTRTLLDDARIAGLSGPEVAQLVFVRMPLGTVLLEEVAFRSVLYAMLARRWGTRAAILGSSALFGLWHVLPSLELRQANAAVGSAVGAGRVGTAIVVAGAVLGTAAAGVLFCELRRRSGSLLPPVALHWAVNGLGIVFGSAVAAR